MTLSICKLCWRVTECIGKVPLVYEYCDDCKRSPISKLESDCRIREGRLPRSRKQTAHDKSNPRRKLPSGLIYHDGGLLAN